jgi:hypothetical protein
MLRELSIKIAIDPELWMTVLVMLLNSVAASSMFERSNLIAPFSVLV